MKFEINKLPSKRYDLFITAFEKYVTKQQEAIRAAESMERIYNLVREALTAADLGNDTRMELEPNALTVTIMVDEGDHISTFAALAANIGAALHKNKLHSDGKPAVGKRGISPRVEYRFVVLQDSLPVRSASIVLRLPDKGCGGVTLRALKSTIEWPEWIAEFAV